MKKTNPNKAKQSQTNPIPPARYAIRDTKYKPKQTQLVRLRRIQTRSLPAIRVAGAAQIPTGQLLGILKLGTNFNRPLQKKLVFQPLVFYKMQQGPHFAIRRKVGTQQTGQAITKGQLQIRNRKFNALEAVFGEDSVGTI